MNRRASTPAQSNARTATRPGKPRATARELTKGDFVLYRSTWHVIVGLDADHVTIPKTGHPGRTVSLDRGQVRTCTAAAMRQAVAAERARSAGRA